MKNFKLSYRLAFLSTTLTLFIIAVGAIGYSSLNQVAGSYKYIFEHHTKKRRIVQGISINALQMRMYSLMMAMETDKEKAAAWLPKIENEIADSQKSIEEYKAVNFEEGEKPMFYQYLSDWEQYKSSVITMDNMVKGGISSKAQILDYSVNQVRNTRLKLEKTSETLYDFHNSLVQAKSGAAQELTSHSNTLILVFGAIATFLGIFLAWWISSNTNRTLTKIVTDVSESSDQITRASEALTTSGQQLATSSQEQASSVVEISSSLEEITGMVAATVKNAKDSVQYSERISNLVDDGSASMAQLSDAVNKIAESNQRVEKLARLIEDIGEKTELIDEIVFQTRLLSFNASVEAERAGEHGRGFAVVAQEVGNLAQMSGKSASEITQIVKNSIKEAHDVVEQNREKVATGVDACKQTNSKLVAIQSVSKEIHQGVSEVMKASEEQSAGINQINQSIQLISQSIQENAAAAEECAGSSRSLVDQSGVLVNVVGDLETIVMGSTSNKHEPKITKVAPPAKNVVSLAQRKPAMAPKAPSFKMAVGDNRGISSDDTWEKL